MSNSLGLKRNHLITLKDERFFLENVNNLVLSSQFLLEEFDNLYSSIKFQVIPEKPATYDDLSLSLDFLQQIENSLLFNLTEVLNAHHEEQFSTREWKIILGHWLTWYITIVARTAQRLSYVLENYKIDSIGLLNMPEFSTVTLDSKQFEAATIQSPWLSAVTQEVMAELLVRKGKEIEFIFFPFNSNLKASSPPFTQKKSVKNRLFNFYDNHLTQNKLSFSSRKVFFIGTYLPRKVEVLTALALRQLPIVRYSFIKSSEKVFETDIILREELIKSIKNTNKNEATEEICHRLVFKFLPKVYLEGYRQTCNAISPLITRGKFPSVVFTSNNFIFDETFKVWLAKIINLGDVRYVVGQHGNNYGVNSESRYVERETADKFLTWGWRRNEKIDIPLFNIKTSGIKGSYSPVGPIVFMLDMFPYPTSLIASYENFARYMESQFNLVSRLPKNIYENTIIRVHPQADVSPYGEIQEWKRLGHGDLLDTSMLNPYKLWKKCSLVVHTYDSTGLLESLTMGIPTLAYWERGLEYMNHDAKDAYEKLAKTGIVHFSIDSLLDKIAEIYDDVGSWWFSDEVVRTRQDFCAEYSRKSNAPVKELKQVLKQIFSDS